MNVEFHCPLQYSLFIHYLKLNIRFYRTGDLNLLHKKVRDQIKKRLESVERSDAELTYHKTHSDLMYYDIRINCRNYSTYFDFISGTYYIRFETAIDNGGWTSRHITSSTDLPELLILNHDLSNEVWKLSFD